MKLAVKEQLNWLAYEGMIIGLDETLSAPAIEMHLNHLKQKDIFSGKIGEIADFTWTPNDQVIRVYLIGLGTTETFDRKKFKKALANAYKQLKQKKTSSIGVDFHGCLHVFTCKQSLSKITAETLIMADYKFDMYKTDRKESPVECIDVSFDGLQTDAFNEGLILGEETVESRILTDTPANLLTPTKLAEIAEEKGKKAGFIVEIKGKKEIEELEMDAFLAVSKGSSEEPKLIVMRYHGNPLVASRLGLVGKGLTYDSGGLSIKPTASMANMKTDMAGAGAVICAMSAIAKMGLKINVTAVVAACENMISGACYKPGDIISSMGKKTIFIGNTDAEGRLTLIDAVHYIQEHEKVSNVVDIATLTGAAIHCLGTDATPMLYNNDSFGQKIEKAFDKADELAWRMPMLEPYKELIKHEFADLTNTAGSPGTITAGMFIGAFIQNDLPWIHLDIAGSSATEKADGIYSKGGTGVGVRPLYYLAQSLID